MKLNFLNKVIVSFLCVLVTTMASATRPEVTVTGAVNQPGVYALSAGEKLSTLLQKVGGFSADAYPYGAVFKRGGARLVVEADYVLLFIKPELDTLLMPGDHLFVPKRQNVVDIRGQLPNKGLHQFVPGCSVKAYLEKAGGVKPCGDPTRATLILPNGNAQKLHLSSWNYRPTMVPPGSIIIVPCKKKSVDSYLE